MKSDEEYFEICRRAAELFLKIPGVHSVGMGGRYRDDKPTGETVIKVFITQKKPAGEVPENELIPAEFEGVPTDVVECAPFEPDAAPGGAPQMNREERRQNRDNGRYRPMVGGSKIKAKRAGAGVGTLGCLLDRTDDASKIYALTNHHVVFGSGGATVANMQVGQPTKKESMTQCCSDIFGKFMAGEDGTHVDAAIVELESGLEYKAEVLEIGVIRGQHQVTVAEAATGTYPVRKRGATTRLTGGTVESIGTVSNKAGSASHTIANGVVIRGNPITGNPSAASFFTHKGDSGAVVVNDHNEIISLHFGRTSSSNPAVFFAKGIAINSVLSWFHSQGFPTLKVATAATPNDVRTVPASAATPEAVPLQTRQLASAREELQAMFNPAIDSGDNKIDPFPADEDAEADIDIARKLESDLTQSDRGSLLRTLWLRHQEEILHLINHNKRVATVWRRSGAAAILQSLLAALHDPQRIIPQTINGRPLSECMARVYDIFYKYSSPKLQKDMQHYQVAFPQIGGLTYVQIIQELDKPISPAPQTRAHIQLAGGR